MEGDADGPEGPTDGVQQAQVLSVELPALTGDTVDAHQPVACIQQPAGGDGGAGVRLVVVVLVRAVMVVMVIMEVVVLVTGLRGCWWCWW